MKLTRENIYINLQGKSKEELTELSKICDNVFLGAYKFLHFNTSSNEWWAFETWRDGNPTKTEVTIQQLKEILQPMEAFTPIAMKCTREQFEAIKPKLAKQKKLKIFWITKEWNSFYLELFEDGSITNGLTCSNSNREVYEEWNEEVFLKACGIEVENIQPMENKEFDLKGYSVEVDNEEQARQLQELAFKQKFYWRDGEIIEYLDKKFFHFNAFNNNKIHYGIKHFKDEYVTKEIHFNDIFKTESTLTKQLEKAEAEVKRLKEAIEEEKKINNLYADYCRENPKERVVYKHFKAGYDSHSK